MDFITELAQPNLDPALLSRLSQALVQGQQDADKVIRHSAEMLCKDTKIAALTLELAHHKRMRFASTSEVFMVAQQDLFDETQRIDLSAIQTELAQLAASVDGTTVAPKTRGHAGRQALPAYLPRVEYRHEPDSCTCGACGKTLVKIGEDH
ncbi:IS66 family transposase [Glaciimonas sp. GG7]